MFFLIREGDDEPHLNCFKGHPGEISPKAAERSWIFAGWLLLIRFKGI
jgi:hypothetical protein